MVYLWDLQTKEVVQRLIGHTGAWLAAGRADSADVVVAVACHPHAPIIASGGLGADCSVRLWADPTATS